MKKEGGFTLVELLITMVVFVLTIAAATGIFVPMLTQFKQQSKIAESNIENIIGLELLKRDIEHAGFGLPWNIPVGITYQEASSSPASNYNEPTVSGTTNPPRAILSGNNVNFTNVVNGSDYLVLKATNIAMSDASAKWTEVISKIDATGNKKTMVRSWGSSVDDLSTSERVIVLIPSKGENNQRILKTSDNDSTKFSVQFNQNFPADFAPPQGEVYLVYGVTPVADPIDTALRMPFNRADYYISKLNIPQKCASNTGVLRKAVLNHSGTFQGGIHQILDCVADMQVIFGRDTDNDGDVDNRTDDLSGLTAQQIREQVKDIRVYILAHEGQKDSNFTYCQDPPSCSDKTIYVGEQGLGRDFDLTTIPDWQNYRWKLDRIVVKPKNLRG
ncbi:MAG: prepilin-type N-terminal cleavage/methylation domain-containing protein [Nitrospirae bacterium]|nr:prepilin-type N-terminal cleavage/methylation domain-containing protein [Nitrospirota bacterium]